VNIFIDNADECKRIQKEKRDISHTSCSMHCAQLLLEKRTF